MRRVLRVGQALSEEVVAVCGITAGSGSATTEMRLIMLRIVDRALLVHPTVEPTLFVDDLAAEVAGSQRWVRRQLVGFVLKVCRDITAAGMEVSAKKSVCLASSEELGVALQADLAEYGVKLVRKTKALGSGLAAGVRRNGKVLKDRLKAFKRRRARYELLKRWGVGTAVVARTGGLVAETYGSEVMGVGTSLLRSQRQAMARAVAPAGGGAGQELDMAMIVADGGPKGMADPAFPAHMATMGHWSMAIWEKWLPLRHLERAVAAAKVKLIKAVVPWQVVYGPAAAFLATAARLGWKVHDAVACTTDVGRELKT